MRPPGSYATATARSAGADEIAREWSRGGKGRRPDEAWEYTEPKSTLVGSGTPTTTVTVVVGKLEVTVIGDIPGKNVVAVAKQVS